MKKLPKPFKAHWVADLESARSILANFKYQNFLKLSNLNNYTRTPLKYRVDMSGRTAEGLLPVEVRSEAVYTDKHTKDNIIPASEWMLLTTDLEIPRGFPYFNVQNHKIPLLKAPPKIAEDNENPPTRIYIHESSLEYRKKELKKLYTSFYGFNHVWEGKTEDERYQGGTSVRRSNYDREVIRRVDDEICLVPREGLHLVSAKGEVIYLTTLPTFDDHINIGCYVGGNFIVLCDEDDEWEGVGEDTNYTRYLFSPSNQFEPTQALRDFIQELLWEINEDLDDPFVTDGDLEDESLHFINGCQDDLEIGIRNFFWAFLPINTWPGQEHNYSTILTVPIRTDALDEYDRSSIDWDSWDNGDNLEIAKAEPLLEVCIDTVIEDNYPAGYVYEYNDQDSSRRSGYSCYGLYFEVDIEVPSEQDKKKALLWVEQYLKDKGMTVKFERLKEIYITNG